MLLLNKVFTNHKMNKIPFGSYVWGLDGSPGTFITDYVIFGLCCIYASCTLYLYKTSKPCREKANKDSKQQNEYFRKEIARAGPYLRVLTGTFFICGIMNGIGALLHHFVPLVEPIIHQPDATSLGNDKLDIWNMMMWRLYPWFLLWQLANVSAALYGISVFLSAVYAIEFYVCCRNFSSNGYVISLPAKKDTRQCTLKFVKKLALSGSLITLLLHTGWRIWRIYEFRQSIFEELTHPETIDVNFNLAKSDIETFGWIWTSTTASVIIFMSFFINALVSTYILIKTRKSMAQSSGSAKVSLVRFIGAWVLFFGGCIQVFWANTCACNQPTNCPFPVWFNHNGLYHLFQAIGMTVLFASEWTSIRGEYFKQKKK